MGLKDQLWTDFMANTEPAMKCPFKETTYKIINATLDLGYIAHLPLNGYQWFFRLKTFKSAARARQKKRFLFCIVFQVTVTKERSERRKTPKKKIT